MENKNIMLEEGVYIKTTPTVLDTDKISILQRKYDAMDIGEMVFNFECIKVLLTNNTNPEIIDDIMQSDFDDELMARIAVWFEKLTEALWDIDNAKKKPSESSENISETPEKKTS